MAVAGADTQRGGVAPLLHRDRALGGVGGIVGGGMPISLLHVMHGLGIVADLLHGIVFAPPDVTVILGEIRLVVGLDRDLGHVAGLFDREDFHLESTHRRRNCVTKEKGM